MPALVQRRVAVVFREAAGHVALGAEPGPQRPLTIVEGELGVLGDIALMVNPHLPPSLVVARASPRPALVVRIGYEVRGNEQQRELGGKYRLVVDVCPGALPGQQLSGCAACKRTGVHAKGRTQAIVADRGASPYGR